MSTTQKEMVLNFDEVRRLLPQSYPFVLVDVVESLEPGQRIVCWKNISGNEWMFPGHFPEKAIYPGVLLLEGMAQAAILLFRGDAAAAEQLPADATFMLAASKARFLQPVVPGDQVRFTVEAVKIVSTGGVVSATATVNDELVAKADLTFAVQN